MAENADKKCTCTGPVRDGQRPVTKQPKVALTALLLQLLGGVGSHRWGILVTCGILRVFRCEQSQIAREDQMNS